MLLSIRLGVKSRQSADELLENAMAHRRWLILQRALEMTDRRIPRYSFLNTEASFLPFQKLDNTHYERFGNRG